MVCSFRARKLDTWIKEERIHRIFLIRLVSSAVQPGVTTWSRVASPNGVMHIFQRWPHSGRYTGPCDGLSLFGGRGRWCWRTGVLARIALGSVEQASSDLEATFAELRLRYPRCQYLVFYFGNYGLGLEATSCKKAKDLQSRRHIARGLQTSPQRMEGAERRRTRIFCNDCHNSHILAGILSSLAYLCSGSPSDYGELTLI